MNDNERYLSRSLKYEKKRRIQLQRDIEAEKEKTKELRIMLMELLRCPFEIDKATIPNAGIQARPEQVVLNVSMGYLRRVKALKLLERLNA